MSQSHYGVPPPSVLRMVVEVLLSAVVLLVGSAVLLIALVACAIGGRRDT